jgi:hypothetical protein
LFSVFSEDARSSDSLEIVSPSPQLRRTTHDIPQSADRFISPVLKGRFNLPAHPLMHRAPFDEQSPTDEPVIDSSTIDFHWTPGPHTLAGERDVPNTRVEWVNKDRYGHETEFVSGTVVPSPITGGEQMATYFENDDAGLQHLPVEYLASSPDMKAITITKETIGGEQELVTQERAGFAPTPSMYLSPLMTGDERIEEKQIKDTAKSTGLFEEPTFSQVSDHDSIESWSS